MLIGCAAAVAPDGCRGVRNEAAMLNLPATALKTVSWGQSWKIEQGSNYLYVAMVKGSAYQMGYALGELYGDEIAKNIKNMADYGVVMFADLVKDYVTDPATLEFLYRHAFLPLCVVLMDLNWVIASSWIPDRYVQEMKGIAMGSKGKVDYDHLRRLNIFPETERAHCTVLGAWGTATADGKLYHLRTLDWESDAYVNEYPSIIIYESTERGSKTFANVGYLGLLGSLTGMSKIGISVGEKVMLVQSASDYPEMPTYTYLGKPWMFVLRDVLQFADNLHQVEDMIVGAKRTC